MGDGGCWPSRAALRGEALNHPELHWLKTVVVNVAGKGAAGSRQVTTGNRRPPPQRLGPAPPPPDDPAPDPAAHRSPRRAIPAGHGERPAPGLRQRPPV